MQKYIFTFLLFSWAYCAIQAQERLSLEQAVARGLENNYDILIQQENVEIAQNNNSTGEAGFYPSVTMLVNQNNTVTDNVQIANPFQLQGQFLSNSVNPQVLLNWDIFKGLSAHINKQRLEVLQQEASGNADITIANTVQAIILGYYRAVLERERLEEFQKQLNLSSDRLKYITIKSDLGSASSTDRLLEQTNYLTDSADYINQLLNYQNAVRDLNFLMGVKEVTTTYDLADDLEHNVKNYEFEELSNRMLGGNVDLRKQYLSQRVLEQDLGLRKAERYPTVNFNAGFFDNRSRNDLSRAYSINSETGETTYGPSTPLTAVTDYYFANFTISFTLFNGNRINRAIENALIREDIGEISTEKLINSLNRDLANAAADYNVKRQLYSINAQKEEVAQLNLQISEEKFRNGTINSFDYRTVQNNYLSASMQKLQSVYNLIDSEVAILRITGDLLTEFYE